MAIITPAAVVLPATITVPADGENIDAADVAGPIQHVADGVKYLATPLASLAALTAVAAPADGTVYQVVGFGWYVFKTSATAGLSPFRLAADDATAGGWLSSTAHETTMVRLCHPSLLPIYGAFAATPVLDLSGLPSNATDYNFRGGACVFSTVVTGSSTALGAAISLDPVLIDGATLTFARLRWKANPGHGALPVLMPKYGIGRVDKSQTTTALLSTGSGLATDASATFGDFNAEHWNDYTPDQNNVVDKTTYGYFLALFNEGGTNALASGGCYSFEVTQSITDARRA